ncbi:MAG TPA: SDR family NAD(P)-dependent oxidoreductase [Actinomycetota bacterium]
MAVVTGGGRGIGREIALALARAGADVVAAGRDEAALAETVEAVRAIGTTGLAHRADVTVAEDLERLAAAVEDRFGAVDVVVANSGIGGPSGRLWELDPAAWEETFAVNVTGVFLTCRAFLPSMVARGAGSVAVIGSMTGKRPLWGRTPYAASKLALVGLVRTLALEAAPSGVRVNLVSPGFVAGERIEWVIRAQAEGRGVPVEQVRGEFLAQIPTGRFVEPAEVAAAVVQVTLDGVPSITGVDVNVTGGTVMY